MLHYEDFFISFLLFISFYLYIMFVDGVKVALGNRGMTVEAARQCAKDRKAWRALVHM